jgi:hypothetical protein
MEEKGMRFYKFDSQGPMFLNRGTGTPGAAAANEGRIFYEDGSEEIFYADSTAWIRMYSENNLEQLIIDIDAEDAWIRKDQDDITAFRLTISDGVIGDVRATDGTLVLENGSDGDDATFEGNILSENGVACLVHADVPANSTFLGTATQAYYAA